MPIITDISFLEELKDVKIGKEYIDYIKDNSDNFINFLIDADKSEAEKKMYYRKLKSSFLNTHEFTELLKIKKYEPFKNMIEEFQKSDIEKRVDYIGSIPEGVPLFIILDQMNIEDISNTFTVLNTESRQLFLDKIIKSYMVIESTFSDKNNTQSVKTNNAKINDSKITNI